MWQKYQDYLIFLENSVIMFGQLVNDFFCVWISSTELIVNPFTLKISSVILPTVCYTVLMMLVWRIWYWINLSNNHLIDIFLYSHHICWVWYWCCEEELSFGHLWELRVNFKRKERLSIGFLKNFAFLDLHRRTKSIRWQRTEKIVKNYLECNCMQKHLSSSHRGSVHCFNL